MKKPTPKIHASTQKFTEIIDIVDNLVLLQGGNAALIIEVTANNFALLSQKEQEAKIYSYAALLNSLTFPIQILIRNKLVDVTSYLKNLEEEEHKTRNELLAKHIKLYREFIHQMVKVNAVLNKQFYIVISYSSLESGVAGAKQKLPKGVSEIDVFAETAKKMLASKADSIHAQLKKLAVSAKTLNKEELVKLFYDIYNEDSIEAPAFVEDVRVPIIKPVTT